MINELQRQAYLSALGVDNYMPRWHLPSAPTSLVCVLPEFTEFSVSKSFNDIVANNVEPATVIQQSHSKPFNSSIAPISSLIGDIFETRKVVKADPVLKNTVSITEVDSSASIIEPFTLSIWNPINEIMIVDSRNAKLALPTEMLLKNIFRNLFPLQLTIFKEEVLRCPMIENSFSKRTIADAQTELQTWLSVQCEIRPIKYLWLMGENAITYLTAEKFIKDRDTWQTALVADSKIHALMLPSLNELLIDPALKKHLTPAIRNYHI